MALGQVLMFPVRLITGVVSFGGSLFGVIGEEAPAYTVLAKAAREGQLAYEVRRYAAFNAISTPSSEQDNGFMTLAGYIGVMGEAKNERQEKISMTTPVISDLKEGGEEKMSFSLPSSVATAPKPTDPRVETVRRPESTWAVHRYQGAWQKEQALEAAKKLREAVGEGAVDPQVAPEWYRFNPPWTISWFRTNEVAVKLRDEGVAEVVEAAGGESST